MRTSCVKHLEYCLANNRQLNAVAALMQLEFSPRSLSSFYCVKEPALSLLPHNSHAGHWLLVQVFTKAHLLRSRRKEICGNKIIYVIINWYFYILLIFFIVKCQTMKKHLECNVRAAFILLAISPAQIPLHSRGLTVKFIVYTSHPLSLH